MATPPGQGGVGIVRVSGANAAAIAEALIGRVPPPRRAHYARFRDRHGRVIDQGLALYFPPPASFTGEAVLELHGHGGPVVMDLLLRGALAAGARPARPGEFTERAFLNDKLDLAQAEAVADLIASASAAAARAAAGSLQGVFSSRVDTLAEEVTTLRLYVEAAIDFPEDDIDVLADERLARRLLALRRRLTALRRDAGHGQRLRDGLRIAIVGRPNAGKSSVLNALTGSDSAIVTAIAGTTRDLLREQIDIDGLPLHLVDTAGLRVSDDPIEKEGVRRALAASQTADRLLLVVDASGGASDALTATVAQLRAELCSSDAAVSVLYNKIDISGRAPAADGDGVWLSAKTGAGVDLLREHLKQCAGYSGAGEGLFSARRRHLQALDLAAQHLDAAARQLDAGAGELAAEELRLAQQALGEITGQVSADELLGRIFSEFCIGK